MKSSRSRRGPPRPRAPWLALVLVAITWVVPRHLGYQLMDGLGLLVYLVVGRYRRATLANLSQVLGRPPSDPLVRATARRCFQTSARNFWDLCGLAHTQPSWLFRRTDMRATDLELLRRLLANRQGVIIVTAHLGAFDYIGQLLTLLPSQPMILTARTTADWLFQVVTWLSSSWGAVVEPVSAGALRRVIGHLRHGGLVGLVADRDFGHGGRLVSFFGRPTPLPVGAARIAAETGAALVAVFCPRDGDHYRFLVQEVPLQRTGNATTDLDANLATLASLFEEAIRAWPDQWVAFAPFWPKET